MDDRLMLAGMMMAQDDTKIDSLLSQPNMFKFMAKDAFDKADALILEYRNRLHNPEPVKDIDDVSGE